MSSSIADIRRDYRFKELSENSVKRNAIDQFTAWWDDAVNSQIDEVNAMTLATASADGIPSARIVLLKGYDQNGFVFFTNYNSFKGQQLTENPRACLVFFWKELERQVRVTGLISKTDSTVSDEYFTSRPEGSRIGAIASPQSQVITDRNWLEKTAEEIKQKKEISRPDHWGGYIVNPVTIEFWQGRSSRLHDRLLYTREEDSWKIQRLAP